MANAKATKATKKASKPAAKTAPAKKSNIDLAALVEEANARIKDPSFDYTMWEDVVALLKPAKAAAKTADRALQLAFWTTYYEVASAGDIREAPEAARALVALDGDASPAVRAMRLARLATAEQGLKKTEGYTTLQNALKLAPDSETRAQVLLEWVGVEHDQVTPAVALLEAFDLANAGELSTELASSVWERCAHAWPLATSAKSRKSQEKLLSTRGWATQYELAFDASKRWLAANPKPNAYTLSVVSTLCTQLCSRDRIDEACKTFDAWTPAVVDQFKKGTVSTLEVQELWFGSHAQNLEESDRKAEAAKLRTQAAKIVGLA